MEGRLPVHERNQTLGQRPLVNQKRMCERLKDRGLIGCVDVSAVVGVSDPGAFQNLLHVVEFPG